MKGLLSLDQELRAARLGKGQKGSQRSNRPTQLNETDRPWQSDIAQIQQTMRELLRAVAGLSGVELPGLPAGLQDNDAPPPRLDIKNLKDRFVNDLEGFSIRTTEELTKRAREQTRAALEAVQNEVGGMVDQVAAEFRENLQLPAQIEKLLEPCIEDAETRLANSISEKFENLATRHEQLVQEKIQGTLSAVQAQMSKLEQTVQEIRDLNAQPSSQQPNAADVEHLLTEHDRSVQGRLHEFLAPVQAQISTLEQAVQQVRELKAVPVAQPDAAEVAGRIDELAAELREKLHDQARIEKLFDPRIEEAAARLEKSISQKFENLVSQHEQLVQQKLQGTLSSVHAQISTLEQTVQDFRNQKSEWVAQASAKQQNAAADVAQLLAEHDRLVQGRLEEALIPFRAQIGTLEQTVQDVRNQKSEWVAQASAKQQNAAADVEQLLAEHDRLVQGRLREALSPVRAQISTLEQTVKQVRELKVEPVVLPAAELPGTAEVAGRIDRLAAEFGEKLKGFEKIEQLLQPRIEESAARLEKSISQKVENLVAQHDRLVQEKLQGTLSSVEAQMGVLDETVQQIRNLQASSVAQPPTEQPIAAADIPANRDAGGLKNGFKDFLDQSFSRIECSFHNLREVRKVQPAQSSSASLEYLRKAIPSGSPDMLKRVQQALDHLDQLGSKDPHPAS